MCIRDRREGPGALWLTIGAEPNDGVTPEKLASEFADFLTASAAEGVPGATVERIKKRLIEDRALSERDPDSFARQLTQWFGQRRSYEDFASYSAAIASVTTDDVNLLLRAVAGPGREFTGVLSPAK